MSGGSNSDGPVLREHQDAVSNWTLENHECIGCGKDGGHHDWSNVLNLRSCPWDELFAYRETAKNMSCPILRIHRLLAVIENRGGDDEELMKALCFLHIMGMVNFAKLRKVDRGAP